MQDADETTVQFRQPHWYTSAIRCVTQNRQRLVGRRAGDCYANYGQIEMRDPDLCLALVFFHEGVGAGASIGAWNRLRASCRRRPYRSHVKASPSSVKDRCLWRQHRRYAELRSQHGPCMLGESSSQIPVLLSNAR